MAIMKLLVAVELCWLGLVMVCGCWHLGVGMLRVRIECVLVDAGAVCWGGEFRARCDLTLTGCLGGVALGPAPVEVKADKDGDE